MRTEIEIKKQIEYLEKQHVQIQEVSMYKGVPLQSMVQAAMVIEKQIQLLKWVLN